METQFKEHEVVEKTEIFDTSLYSLIERLDDTVVAKQYKKKLYELFQQPKGVSEEGINTMKSKYYRKGYKGEHKIGRVYAKNSLACLPGIVRETMCKPYYWDIDFKAAHFQFAYHLMKLVKSESTCTEMYIKDREKTLNDVAQQLNLSKKEVKNLFIVAMYGGNAFNKIQKDSTDPDVLLANRLSEFTEKDKQAVTKCDYLQRIHIEFQKLAERIDQIFTSKEHIEGLPDGFFDWGNIPVPKKNRKLIKDCFKTEPRARGFCLLSHLLQHIEWQCIEKLDQFLTERNYSVDMLIHDGLKIRKKPEGTDKCTVIELLKSDSLKEFYKESIGMEFIIDDPIVIKEDHETLCEHISKYQHIETDKLDEFYRDHYFHKGKLFYFPRNVVYETPEHIDPIAFNQSKYLKYLQKSDDGASSSSGKTKKQQPVTIQLMLRNYKIPPRSLVDTLEYRAFGDKQKYNPYDINPEQYKKYNILNTYRPAAWVYFKCAMDVEPSKLHNINVNSGDSFEEAYINFIKNLKQNLAWKEGEEEEFKSTMVYKQITQYLVDPDSPGYEYNLKYFINWIARCLFQPEKKSETCLTLKNSIGGTGKSGYCEHFLAPLFGEQYRLVTDPSIVLGNFNATMKGKSLVIFDDICLADTAKAADKFKSLITAKTVEVNDKYEKIVSCKNYTSFLITTNRPGGAVLHEEGNTRRFPVIDCKEHRLTEDEINKLKIESEQKKSHLIKYLAQNYDFNFNFAKLPTSVSMDQTALVAKNIIKRSVDFLINGFYPSHEMISNYNSDSNVFNQFVMNFFFTFNSILHNLEGDKIGENYKTVSELNQRIYRKILQETVNVQATHFFSILAECANACSVQKTEKMTSSKIRVNHDCVKFIKEALEDPDSGFTEKTKRGEKVTLWYELSHKQDIHEKTIQINQDGRVFTINVNQFKNWVTSVYSPTEIKKRKELEPVVQSVVEPVVDFEEIGSTETMETTPVKKQRCSQSVQDSGKYHFSFKNIPVN